MKQNEGQDVSQKGANALTSDADFCAFGSFCFHLVLYQKRPEVGDEYRSRCVHPKGIGKHIDREPKTKADKEQIHPADLCRKDENTGNVDEAECIIKQYHIAHKKDLQQQVKQNH